MKVLHIHSGNLFGGVETLLVTLAKWQHLCPPMQPHYALCFEGRLATELGATGSNVHQLGEVQVSHLWKLWKARHQLDRLLWREHFDVVVCHSCWAQIIFGAVVKAHRLPLVFWCHDTPKGNHWLEHGAKRVQPDLVIANSDYTLAALPKLYPNIHSDRLYSPVPSNLAISPSIREEVRYELNTPDDMVVIIQSSRLERWKGQNILLSALAQLQEVPNWVCWMVGGAQRTHEMEYFQSLQTQAHEMKLTGRVRFLGQRSDVPRLLAAADIHCQPNTGCEPFGIAFIEALYAGLPVVTTAMGAALEIIDPSCGLLVEPNSVDALSKALKRLVENSDQRAELASGGPLRANYLCNPARQMAQLHRLLEQQTEQRVTA